MENDVTENLKPVPESERKGASPEVTDMIKNILKPADNQLKEASPVEGTESVAQIPEAKAEPQTHATEAVAFENTEQSVEQLPEFNGEPTAELTPSEAIASATAENTNTAPAAQKDNSKLYMAVGMGVILAGILIVAAIIYLIVK